MKDWGFGINSRPEFRYGHVELVEQPLWLAMVEKFGWWICWDWLHKIEFPDWWTVEREGEKYSASKWYGDVGCWVHIDITNPILQWVWKHPKRKRITVEVGYDRVKELFYAGNEELFDADEARRDGDDDSVLDGGER